MNFQILIIDDDVDLAETIQEILEDAGYEAIVALNGREAMERLESHDPQLALVDFRIGQDNGLEVIQQIKERYPELTCIMMTAHAELDTAIGAIKAGVEDFLQKPLPPVVLLTAVERVAVKLRLIEERESALRDLAESEARFQGFMDNSPITAFMKDESGTYVWANKRAEKQARLLGQNSPVGMKDDALFPPKTAQNFQENDARVLNDGIVVESTEDIEIKGEVRHFLTYRFPFTGKNGERFISGVGLDITEQRRNEVQIKNQQQLLEAVFDSLPIWLSVKDRDLRYLMVNRQTLADTGLKIEDYMSSDTVSLPLGDSDEMRRNLEVDRQVLSTGEPKIVSEHQHTLPNGEVHLYLHSKAPYRDAEGDIAGIVTASVDITELKNAERALRESEGRFRNLSDGSLQGIIIHNGMQPVYCNASFARIFEAKGIADILGKPSIGEFFQSQFHPFINGEGLNTETDGEQSTPKEILGTSLNGETVNLEVFRQVIVWENQPCIQLTLMDITRQHQLETQLRQSQKMEAVGQLAGGVAHDFNNMLQIIHGYAELAANQIEKTKDPLPTIERIRQTAEDAGNLARQLLAFSRREALKHAPIKPNALIENLLKMVRRVIGETIELTFTPCEEPGEIVGDKGAVEQVLLNLCVNARDAMPEGGTLTLSTENFEPDAAFKAKHDWATENSYVLLRVRDSGTGISEENLNKIFEPFFTTKETGKGTGLGLSMAYGTLRQHHGMITVESQKGVGTEFQLYLPKRKGKPGADEASPEKAVMEKAKGGKETILVAEDDESVLRLVVELLKSKGYTVLTAHDGEEAVEVFKSASSEVKMALVDVVMPKKSGRYVYEEIKRINPNLPVLFSTGYTGNVLDEEFVRQEEFKLIRKPYAPNDLFQIVRDTLDEIAG